MKPIRYIAYTALCSLLLVVTGCQKEEPTKQSDSSTFTIQIAGESSSSALTRAEVHEKVTSPLHLLIYKAGATDGTAPVFYKKDDLTDTEAKTIKCTLPSGLSVTDKYDVYVVGSADTDAAGISDATTKSQLLALIQTNIAEITSKTKPYMLAGVTLNVALDSSPTVKIVRNVCRLDLTLTDESGNNYTTIEATLSAPDRTFLFSSALRGTGLENSFPADTKDTEQVLNLTDANKFTGSLFFFEKMTTADGVKTEADRVKLSIKATNALNEVFQYVIYLNADDNYTTTRNTIYEVNGKMKDGTIIIKTEKLPWDEVVQGEETPDPIIIQPKANTYLVAPSSNAILIPVAQANEANTSNITANEVLTAELVWTDVKGKTKGLALDAAVAAIEVIGSGPEAALMVTPGSQLGNAVIAVKGTGGVIKWSWHIWVTDYDPEQETGQNTSGGYIFMDRNLGAKSILPTTTGEDIIGNYYQFGRKDPFPTKSNVSGFVTTYNANGDIVAQTAGSTTSAENQIRNPYLWGNETGYPGDLELWGETGNKTVNDPCPSGWRVPSSNAYVDLNYILLPNDAAIAGRKGAHTGYYPYTWFKNPNSTFNGSKLVVNWTSTPSGTSNGLFLRTEVGTSVTGNYASGRTYGHGVRCVRDWTKGKFEKEIRVLTVGANTPCAAHQLGTDPATRNYTTGLNPLLTNNFGQGSPVDVFFKHYTHYNGGAHTSAGVDYKIMEPLETHQIDVLYLSWNGWYGSGPTVVQSKEILKWLDADSHRVLIINIDLPDGNGNIVSELGFAPYAYGQSNEVCVLAGGDSEVYKALMDGKYGKLASTNFTSTEGHGNRPKADMEKNGFVPILTHSSNANIVTMAVNPVRNVILLGDNHWFEGGNGLGADGSIGYKAKGEYPLLFANMWAWIAETVKGR